MLVFKCNVNYSYRYCGALMHFFKLLKLQIIFVVLFSSFCVTATQLFKLFLKYRPEDKAAKKERLLKRAQAEAEGKTVETKKPIVIKYGLNHVTYLIEQVPMLISKTFLINYVNI